MTPSAFVHVSQPSRVVFGAGRLAELGREIEALGATRVLILCSPSQRTIAARAADALGAGAVGIFDRATMHVPLELAREARRQAAELSADAAVAIGGGSAIGLGKAIALEASIPILAVPTTYAGSEMTPIYGLTEHGRKRTGRDPRVLPRTVIYDPELSRSLPLDVAITSAFNAIAHAAEGLYARDASPIASLMAEEAIRALGGALGELPSQPGDLALRTRLLYGAWLAGSVLGSVGMALHHRICHVLGGRLDLPHGPTHTVVLPHVLAFNAGAAPEAMARIGRALGGGGVAGPDAATAIHDLARRTGAPLTLRELGMTEADVDPAVEDILANPPWNPRPLEAEPLRQLLIRALDGAPPR